jgi:2-polyprenyl-6-hydroxyphenyl methylase/3-demethylubiquinone-9 3-methyltransferase
VPADNTIYDTLGHSWWDEHTFLHLLRSAFNARIEYFISVLRDHQVTGAGMSALDIGMGGGLVAEQFAELGFTVTGIDPSMPSLRTAATHATSVGLTVRPVRAFAEFLPFADASFDLVYCCDVLEHVVSVRQTISEAGRVLRPGGWFCFDTINRTPVSWLLVIKIAQEWPATAFMPPGLHGFDMFVRPEEIRDALPHSGLVPGGITGLGPAGGPIGSVLTLWNLFLRARGRIGYAELARRVPFRPVGSLDISYAGWARKRAPRH